jgi:hypothetical protein
MPISDKQLKECRSASCQYSIGLLNQTESMLWQGLFQLRRAWSIDSKVCAIFQFSEQLRIYCFAQIQNRCKVGKPSWTDFTLENDTSKLFDVMIRQANGKIEIRLWGHFWESRFGQNLQNLADSLSSSIPRFGCIEIDPPTANAFAHSDRDRGRNRRSH